MPLPRLEHSGVRYRIEDLPALAASIQDPGSSPVAVLAIGGLQLRASLATADATHPRASVASWFVILGLAVVVMLVAGYPSFVALWFVAATGAMVLPPRWGIAAFAASVIAFVVLGGGSYAGSAWTVDFWSFLFYLLTVGAVGATGMYVAARMVPVVDQLARTRADLSLSAVDRERRRFSRDLHDTLGQGLSAIALRSDMFDDATVDEQFVARDVVW